MDATTYADLRAFAAAWGLTQPRILAMFIAVPLFTRQLMPGLLRFGLAGGIGLVTPPVGSVLFIGTAIGKITIAQSLRTIWPFWLAGVVVLLLVAFVPELSMWLPAALKH